MRILIALIQKEFLQVFRNKSLLPMIFMMPFIQLVVLVNAATQEMKNIRITVVDNDLSSYSRRLTGKFSASPFFVVNSGNFSIDEAQNEIALGKTDMILNINHGFEDDMITKKNTKVQILVDAINAQTGQLGYVYASSVLNQFSGQISIENQQITPTKQITTNALYWFNPTLNYHYYMFPGIMVILVTIIGMLLTAFNLVREKEIGTIEQINVTPVKKSTFLIAKLLPFWIIGIFEVTIALILGKLLYGLPFAGSIALLYLFAGVYLVAALSLGLIISTVSNTQQQVMFVGFFFILIFQLMSGVFTSADNMPWLAQQLNYLNPMSYFIKVIRMIILKGSGFADILPQFIGISIYAILALTISIKLYHKRN